MSVTKVQKIGVLFFVLSLVAGLFVHLPTKLYAEQSQEPPTKHRAEQSRGLSTKPHVERSQGRVIFADVVALDQVVTYNRFGSFNPYGMIYALRHDVVDESGIPIGRHGGLPGQVRLRADKRPRPLVLRANVGDILEVQFTNLLAPDVLLTPDTLENDQPATRSASIVASGLVPKPVSGDNHDPLNTGISGIAPGETITYRWKIEREGTYFFFSNAAPAGGEGDGGSLVLGLFGTINAEPAGSTYYRSQVSEKDMLAAREQAVAPNFLNYEAIDIAGTPILNMLKSVGRGDDGTEWLEIRYGDLNALITGFEVPPDSGTGESLGWFREFSVIFHGELKTVFQKEFQILDTEDQLSGIRDGFGINYGASGVGTVLLANRLQTGPAKDCVECLYEEFFLQSWANGDPALLVQYEDDPSNVHHSYLGDNVRFRNIHAGPKETHVFHLHAHQWISQSGSGTGTYLDSQTIGPQQSFTYNIFYSGGGNRNLTPGDSIFHCHLYPHFAQGMWELWRVHDVFEDGSRRLPDGELGSGTDPHTGETVGGTPIPAVVPMPKQAMAPMPTYSSTIATKQAKKTKKDKEIVVTKKTKKDKKNKKDKKDKKNKKNKKDKKNKKNKKNKKDKGIVATGKVAMPGYPFYIAGKAGHRVPQAPMDIHENAGLPRHVILGGSRTTHEDLAGADFSVELHTAEIQVLPQNGTPLEQAAMQYHGGNAQLFKDGKRGYPSVTPEGKSTRTLVNGHPAQPGAPFADPCVSDDLASVTATRDYHVSAIQLDLLVNSSGWHDPQARINVLDEDVGNFEGKLTKADPFFFRVLSGECVRFFHTNRTPGELEVDDFQMQTPTDTIGQHIHLVKFDVTASDGSANGWNYEDGTFSRQAVEGRIQAGNLGTVTDWQGNTLPELKAKVDAEGRPVYQTTVQRWWADPLINASGADRTIGTVFSHDHFAPSSIQQHGFYNAMLVEPAGSKWLKPDGKPLKRGVGTQALIQDADDPILHPNHREFAMAVADYALIYDALGNPVDPPLLPEAISTEHHNPFLVNYKNEPIPLRITTKDADGKTVLKDGTAGDMAHVFDSKIHGDPFTEIFRAYESDRVRIKLIQGAQEVQHEFTVQGTRWRRNIWDPDSPLVGVQELGISEHFEIELPRMVNRVTNVDGMRVAPEMDHLYHFGSSDDMWNGAWGLIRYVNPQKERDKEDPKKQAAKKKASKKKNSKKKAPKKKEFKEKLKELEGHAAFDSLDNLIEPESNSLCPPDPEGKATKEFNIQAWAAADLVPGGNVVYNLREGIADPSGLLFIEVEDHELTRDEIIASFANKPVEPLVLRANAGDCIFVHLKNMLPKNVPDHFGDAGLPLITELLVDDFRPSNQVSLMPQLLEHDSFRSGGGNIGGNPDQTAGPGDIMDYMWYAGRLDFEPHPKKKHKLVTKFFPEEYGAINLNSYGDVIKHGAQGLVGALIIEPEKATVVEDPTTRTAATVCYPTDPNNPESPTNCFREFVLVYQDGLNLLHLSKNIPNCPVCDDSYDLGERAINYRAEPFWARLDLPSTNVDTNAIQYPPDFFLDTFKSIETPVFEAKPTDEVRFRVLQPHGRTRQHTFLVYGHDYNDLGIPNFGTPHASLITVGKGLTAKLRATHEGTWLYRDGPNFFFSGGIWGQFIVKHKTP